MHYNIFKRTIKTQKKTVARWYYSFIEPETKIKKQRVIPDCKNKAEAYAYISTLPDLDSKKVYIKDIAKDMFIPGSMHLERLKQHGSVLAPETLLRHRTTLNLIIKQFGDMELKDLTVMIIDNYLTSDTQHTGSWKNAFLETLSHIYKEAPFYGCNNIIKPEFRRFKRNTKKADIFSTEELNSFFDYSIWNNERDYLALLCMASFGLRIGEVRGIKIKQFIFEKNALIVDGFCKSNGFRTDYNKKGSDEDKKWRITFAPESTINKIQDYINQFNLQEEDFLFQREDGTPIRREYLEDVFNRQLKKAGINKCSRKLIPHSFRFTYVTRMRRNTDVETIRKMAGHSTVEMTDYYTRASIPELVSSLENVVPAVNQLFE